MVDVKPALLFRICSCLSKARQVTVGPYETIVEEDELLVQPVQCSGPICRVSYNEGSCAGRFLGSLLKNRLLSERASRHSVVLVSA